MRCKKLHKISLFGVLTFNYSLYFIYILLPIKVARLHEGFNNIRNITRFSLMGGGRGSEGQKLAVLKDLMIKKILFVARAIQILKIGIRVKLL